MTQDPNAPEFLQADFGGLDALPPRPSVWPKVIGIISIAWGCLGLVGLPVTILMRHFNRQQQQVIEAMPDWYRLLQPVIYVMGAAFAVLLLAAGLTTLRRRPVGRTLHLVYVIALFAWQFVNVPIIIMVMDRTMEVMNGPPEAKAIAQCTMIPGLLPSALPTPSSCWSGSSAGRSATRSPPARRRGLTRIVRPPAASSTSVAGLPAVATTDFLPAALLLSTSTAPPIANRMAEAGSGIGAQLVICSSALSGPRSGCEYPPTTSGSRSR